MIPDFNTCHNNCILLSGCVLKENEDIFLDGMTLDELRTGLRTKEGKMTDIEVVRSGDNLIKVLNRRDEIRGQGEKII